MIPIKTSSTMLESILNKPLFSISEFSAGSKFNL